MSCASASNCSISWSAFRVVQTHCAVCVSEGTALATCCETVPDVSYVTFVYLATCSLSCSIVFIASLGSLLETTLLSSLTTLLSVVYPSANIIV